MLRRRGRARRSRAATAAANPRPPAAARKRTRTRVDDDVERAQRRQPRLALVDQREADLLPGLGGVGALGGVDRVLPAVQLDEGGRQAAPVGQVREQDARRLEEALLRDWGAAGLGGLGVLYGGEGGEVSAWAI